MLSDTKKLAVLRSRTDHDLLILVKRELERGFALLEVATDSGSPLFAQAEKAYARAMQLWPKISGLSQDERAGLDEKFKQLRFRLNHPPTIVKVRSFPASAAS